ncbi:hypothetical protein ACOBQX_26740 [Actinokineospora sp. G85]|uniref:hypothetical protein n=1 Tax=Actinokineospora sp. G85 TaxID=3406626 RepID=UPI003C7350A2
MAVSPERYRRACDYLSAAMIYLRDNVLLREPLRVKHLKPRLLGHWGTCPGITYLYTALNRVGDERTLLVTGPGHGAPAIHANLWLEGTHERFEPRPGPRRRRAGRAGAPLLLAGWVPQPPLARGARGDPRGW